jgi:hypothetical protein
VLAPADQTVEIDRILIRLADLNAASHPLDVEQGLTDPANGSSPA